MKTIQEIAYHIRIDILKMLNAAGSGHLGGSLDLVEIFTWLYFKEMQHRPKEPDWNDRDRLVLSIGHVAPVLYASLAHAGYFPKEELLSLRQLGSRLQGHPCRNVQLPGIELAAGSLGQGVGVAVGMALAAQHDHSPQRIFCIMGDGELQEGSVWEAFMSAAHYHLNHFIAIIDRNGVQIDGTTEQVMALEPLSDKLKSFGLHVEECNGNDFFDLENTFNHIKSIQNQPIAIIANTKMGYGVPEIEGNNQWHGKVPNNEEVVRFIQTLRK
ncbi:MAG: transketolase [Bacteroidales bacterium]|nr:transketolase [Bacteroidales bacterium]